LFWKHQAPGQLLSTLMCQAYSQVTVVWKCLEVSSLHCWQNGPAHDCNHVLRQTSRLVRSPGTPVPFIIAMHSHMHFLQLYRVICLFIVTDIELRNQLRDCFCYYDACVLACNVC
jgi:hypothetical protein